MIDVAGRPDDDGSCKHCWSHDAARLSRTALRGPLATTRPLLSAARPEVALPFRLRLAPSRTSPLLRRANGIEDFDETKIHLASFHIYFDHLNLHTVSQTVDASGVLAAQ
jgi:hypothetical protein